MQSFHTDELNVRLIFFCVAPGNTNLIGTLQAFLALYTEMLEDGAGAFETIFTHLRHNPNERCLVHCTGSFYLYITIFEVYANSGQRARIGPGSSPLFCCRCE